LEYERLVIAASLQDKVNLAMHRPVLLSRVARAMVKAVEERNMSLSQIPSICLSEKFTEKMIRVEMEQEQKFFSSSQITGRQ
jgi:hypothetical protein